MNNWLDFFVKDSFQTYEDFEQEIEQEIQKKTGVVEKFLKFLTETKKKEIAPILKDIKEWVETSSYSSFSRNCLYFYRWLISKGYKHFEDSEIDSFFTFLNTVGVTDSTAAQVKWGVAFLVKGKLDGDNEHFWKRNILKYFSLTEKDLFTFTELTTYFMVYHIGLKQFFDKENKKLTETQHIIINNYMTLVNRFPQLEEVFGVIIEKDIFRVYSIWETKEKGGKKKQ